MCKGFNYDQGLTMLLRAQLLSNDKNYDYITIMLLFCNVTADKELTSKLSSDFSTFHRTNKASFDHFTKEQNVLVNRVVFSISERLKDTFGTSHNITEYISE